VQAPASTTTLSLLTVVVLLPELLPSVEVLELVPAPESSVLPP
jgi:hypothetical protein